MKKTPIETAIEQLNKSIEYILTLEKVQTNTPNVEMIFAAQGKVLRYAIDILTALLPDERKEIEGAYRIGVINKRADGINFKDASDYFTSTYAPASPDQRNFK